MSKVVLLVTSIVSLVSVARFSKPFIEINCGWNHFEQPVAVRESSIAVSIVWFALSLTVLRTVF